MNEHWMDRLSQAAIRSVTDTSPAIDVLYLLEEDAPEQSVLGLCKKLLAKLLDGADEGVHDIVMQYATALKTTAFPREEIFGFISSPLWSACSGCLKVNGSLPRLLTAS